MTVLLLALAAVSSLSSAGAVGIVFTVNSTTDGGDVNLADGLCDDGTGHCTLRAAIEQANASTGTDTINFSIGSGTQTITPSSALPVIADPLIIDGTSQPGFSGNPIIQIDGENAGHADGLAIIAGNSTVKGLVINRFSQGAAIDIFTNGANVISGNFLGTDITGTTTLGNKFAAQVLSSNNTIGGTSASARNLISGNSASGVLIAGANGNQVEGNYIGTAVGGSTALGNGGDGVVILDRAAGNTIGGTSAGAGNLISGNMIAGIELVGFASNVPTGNEIQGNFVGTDRTGTAALPNTRGGIELSGASNTTVGGTGPGARNLISGNGGSGVFLGPGSSANALEGNLIGTDVSGSAALGNGFDGVSISSAPDNTIGGTAAGAGNVISANKDSGVGIDGAGASGNQIQGNLIGTDSSGLAALGNYVGVLLERSPNNVVGSAMAGARNLISGNKGDGVLIDQATGNQVLGNLVGTDIHGKSALGNGGVGVDLLSATDNGIGGLASGAGNVISANGREGISIAGSQFQPATGNQMQGNFIGTDVSGTVALGNGSFGLLINGGESNIVGGTSAGARNLISGNFAPGVAIIASAGSASNNQVKGNFIGTDAAGTASLYNHGDGIEILASSFGLTPPIVGVGNLIGGTTPGEANTVAYNQGSGVEVNGAAATGNTIRGNSIHTNKTKGIANVSGGNTELPPPIIASAVTGPFGSASGTACGTCTVDVYSDSADEGRIYEGSTSADGMGHWSFFGALSGPKVTATATDGGGDTSEFSTPFQGLSSTPSPTPTIAPVGGVVDIAVGSNGGRSGSIDLAVLISLTTMFASLAVVAFVRLRSRKVE